MWNAEEDKEEKKEEKNEEKKKQEEEEQKYDRDLLTKLAMEIVPYHMKHNAESEACDLLMELEMIDQLEQFVDKDSYPRVCLYLTR